MAGTQLFNFASGSGGGTTPGDFSLGAPIAMPGMTGSQGPSMGAGALPLIGASGSASSIPGVVPQQNNALPGTSHNPGGQPNTPYAPRVNSGYFAGSSIDPGLTYGLFDYLQSQIGKGVQPFNLSAVLGSSGATTAPGTLSAPNNALIQQLMQGFQGQGKDASLGGLVANGNPIDQTPAWNAMVQSMQQNIQRNQANLKEQFNVGGNLVGSPYGDAMQNYMSQTASTENAQLLGAQTTALEQAKQDQMQATGMMGQFSQFLQSQDQSSIDRMLQEFIRDSPQNNPLLNMEFGAATTFPPYMQAQKGGGVMGGIASLLSGAGSAGGGLAAMATAGLI